MSEAPERIDMMWHEDTGNRVGIPVNCKGNIEYVRADLYDKQAKQIAELEARLREEIISSYDDLTLTRKSRYTDAEAYADAVLKSEQQP